MFGTPLFLLPLLILLGSLHVSSHDLDKSLCGNHSNEREGYCWDLQHKNDSIHLGDDCQITRFSVDASDPESEQFVADPCMKEETRNFMECVLDYNPEIVTTDPRFNSGTCQCYKRWSKINFRPAYNHSKDPEKDANKWFVWSKEFKECVVKEGEACALAVSSVSSPYRCETVHHAAGVCREVGPENIYKVCTNGANKESVVDPTLLILLLSVSLS